MTTLALTHELEYAWVPVDGGQLRVGVWHPLDADGARLADDAVVTLLAIHGVTASHLAWAWVAERVPGVRVIAPDLRGRGRSTAVAGQSGMRAHAADMAAILDHFGVAQTAVIGHSMGGFVAAVMSSLYPERVAQLMLLDGGLPLDVPAVIAPEDLVAAVLGPTAERLSRRFAHLESYLDFWRGHPAFQGNWSPALEDYFAYDLVAEGADFRPATSYQVTLEDTVDLNTGTDLPQALAQLRRNAVFVTVPRGLLNEVPGLYSDAQLAEISQRMPWLRQARIEGVNHYTVVMSATGAAKVAAEIVRWLGNATPSR